MSRYAASRYGYDYSLTPARPTGWRGTFANMTIFATVMAVSAISGVVVALELFGSSASPAIAAPAIASLRPASHAAAQPPASRIAQVFALVTASKTAPATAPNTSSTSTTATATSTPSTAADHVAPPATVAAGVREPPPAAAPAPQPTPVADSDLTFARGYAQRQAVAHGAPVRNGQVVVEAKTQLGRGAVKSKPKTYARNTNTNAQDDQRRVAAAQRPDAFGMFQRFDRPDQSEAVHHQALAFGEQRTTRRSEAARAPTPPYGNSPNGLFGGLF